MCVCWHRQRGNQPSDALTCVFCSISLIAAGPDASDESGEGAPQLTREAWFHEGSGALVEARREIAVYSLERARDRLVAQRRELATTEASKRAAEIQTLHRNLKVGQRREGEVSEAERQPEGKGLSLVDTTFV